MTMSRQLSHIWRQTSGLLRKIQEQSSKRSLKLLAIESGLIGISGQIRGFEEDGASIE
jgi:hypothetical protein